MNSITIANKSVKPNLSIKTQTLATIAAIVSAVALPQVFHVIGSVSGYGTVPGEIFLPMHLPIILVGLLAGPYAGAVSGAFAPVISCFLTGMPGIIMLPFMMIELCIYGLSAGLLRKTGIPVLGKVLISQVAGRMVRGAAIFFAVYALGNTMVSTSTILSSIVTGLPGLIIQWCMLPLVTYYVENITKDESKVEK